MSKDDIRPIPVVLMTFFILFSTTGPSLSGTGSVDSSYSSDISSDIGLTTWINIGKNIDLDKVSSIFETINYQDTDGISGTYSFYVDNYNTETVYLVITNDGYIMVFYLGGEPASKTISWNGDKTVFSKFATAMLNVGQSLGYNIDYRNIKYYDYRYPDANRMLTATQSVGKSFIDIYSYGNLKLNIPNYATVYETSYSLYLNDPYNGGANIAIDSDVIDSVTSNGVIYNTYSGYISTNVDHLLGVMSGQYAQCGVAMVIIYKDDNDDTKNEPTILVNNADNSFDGILENPEAGRSTYTPIPTYTISTPPIPTPIKTPKITVPIPTIETTEITEIPTPSQTAQGLRPQKASVDLHGERTNVELGQQILLKGSVVSFNTNPAKMHAQVIIIPPSGMSVISADFVKSPAGQYTSDFELDPGKGKDIEITIIPNEAGEFKVTCKIAYYFGDDKSTGEYEEKKLDIKVRTKDSEKSAKSQYGTPQVDNTPKDPGFEIIFVIGTLMILYLSKKRY